MSNIPDRSGAATAFYFQTRISIGGFKGCAHDFCSYKCDHNFVVGSISTVVSKYQVNNGRRLNCWTRRLLIRFCPKIDDVITPPASG